MRTSIPLACLTLAALALAPACTSSLDLDRFKQEAATVQSPASASAFGDLSFACKTMLPHINEYFEVRVVDKDDVVKAKVVYDSLVSPDFSFELAQIIPKSNPPYRLDFWADQNGSFTYSGNKGSVDEKDHGWRRTLENPLQPEAPPLPPNVVPFTDGRYALTFVHDTDFTDLFTNAAGAPVSFEDTLLGFNASIIGADAFVGKMIELRVTEPLTRRLVGVHRKGRAQATYKPQILGILDEQTPYEIAIYVDQDGDQRYAAGEPSWVLTLTSTADGIVEEIDLAKLPQTPLPTAARTP